MTKKLADVTKDLKLEEKEPSAAEIETYTNVLRTNMLEMEVDEIERQYDRNAEMHDLDISERPIYMALEAIKTLGHLRSACGPAGLAEAGINTNTTLIETIDAKLIELIGLIELEDVQGE